MKRAGELAQLAQRPRPSTCAGDDERARLFNKTDGVERVVIEQAQHARPGTGGTATAQTMGELAEDIRATKGSHMPAEIQRYTPPQSARIILFCYTPHTRPSAASSATTALTINFTNHRVLSQRSLIYPYTVAERVRPPFCALQDKDTASEAPRVSAEAYV